MLNNNKNCVLTNHLICVPKSSFSVAKLFWLVFFFKDLYTSLKTQDTYQGRIKPEISSTLIQLGLTYDSDLASTTT